MTDHRVLFTVSFLTNCIIVVVRYTGCGTSILCCLEGGPKDDTCSDEGVRLPVESIKVRRSFIDTGYWISSVCNIYRCIFSLLVGLNKY